MKSIQDFNELNLFFLLKSYENDDYNSWCYITHVLGHEGENSLLSYLINEDLATALIIIKI